MEPDPPEEDPADTPGTLLLRGFKGGERSGALHYYRSQVGREQKEERRKGHL